MQDRSLTPSKYVRVISSSLPSPHHAFRQKSPLRCVNPFGKGRVLPCLSVESFWRNFAQFGVPPCPTRPPGLSCPKTGAIVGAQNSYSSKNLGKVQEETLCRSNREGHSSALCWRRALPVFRVPPPWGNCCRETTISEPA